MTLAAAATTLAGAIGAIAFVELFVRLGGMSRVNILMGLYARSWRVVRSRRISDHWKERVLLVYVGRILRTAGLFVGQLAAGLAATVALGFVVVYPLAPESAAHGAFLAGWPFNVAAVVAGTAYAALRGRIAR